MSLSQDNLKNLFIELSEWLEFEDCDPVDWVVCGGVALSFQNLNHRTTSDVDVLGNWNSALAEITLIEEFPQKVIKCIDRVVELHPELAAAKPKWVNLTVRQLVCFGLPIGFQQRMVSLQFGAKLTLHLLGRDDLLALKLYAASDEFGRRQAVHLNDLRELKPTFDELDRAIDWIRTLPNFEVIRPALKNIAEDFDEGFAQYL